MTSAGQAIAAASAGDMPLTAHDVAGIEVVYVRSNLDNLADKFMPDGHRHGNCFLRPVVPLIDVNVGPADTGIADADQHVIDPHRGLCDTLQPTPMFRAPLHQTLHKCLIRELLSCIATSDPTSEARSFEILSPH